MDFADLNESMGAFESAVASAKARVIMPTCGTVLLAVDGSSQDDTAIDLAALVTPRLRAKLRVTMGAYGDPEKADRSPVERALARLKDKFGVEATAVYEAGRAPCAQILAAQKSTDAGLIVVPGPYLDDIADLKDESLGSTVDLLLAEFHGGLLVVREPLASPELHLKRFLLPMTVYTPALASAAGWAFSLAEGEALIDLYAVADQKAVEAAAEVTGDASDEARSIDVLLRAEHKNAGGMISAVQQRASETSVNVNVDLDAGEPIDLTLTRLHAEPSIAVLGAPIERTADEFHRVHDIVLGAKYPVLIARA